MYFLTIVQQQIESNILQLQKCTYDIAFGFEGFKMALWRAVKFGSTSPKGQAYTHNMYIYIWTVSSQLFFSLGTLNSFLAGLGRNQVHVALSKWLINQFCEADNRRLELTVLIYTLLLYICTTPLHLLYLMIWGIWHFKLVHKQPISNAILESHYKDTIFFKCFSTYYVFSQIHCFSIFAIISYGS